ncbi:MAG: NADH-quinone oxidoreductase subunit NuoE [Alphaproteobacteria bacterium]|nr:MAG: NADH-quinone oxidoreductase subunit NuoE [Alphaproteobacteria bacterium]
MITHAIASHGGPRGAILEALRMVQHAEGWVSDERVADIAALTGMTTAEIDNLATFYSHIFRKPVGRHLVMFCDGASCWMNGGDKVAEAVKARLGIGFGETTADGRFTLLNTCCVGGCDHAPAAVTGRNRRLVGPLRADTLDGLLT